MAYYASSSPERPEQPLVLTSEPSSPSCSRIDDASFLSTDVDVSFASISVNSQPATPTEDGSFLLQQGDAMDISPMPPRRFQLEASGTTSTRPRSKTLGGLNFTRPKSTEERPFGRELSNTRSSSKSPPKAPVTIRNIKASPEASPVASLFADPSPSTKPLSARQRAGLPTTWLQPKAPSTRSSKRSPGSIFSKPSALFDSSSPEKSHRSDVMDLDSSPRKFTSSAPFITSSPPRPEPASDSDELGELFFDSASPSAPVLSRKRRSQEDIQDQENRAIPNGQRSSREGSPQKSASVVRARPRSSSPGESPCVKRTLGTSRPFERFNTTGGTGSLLFGQPPAGRKGPIRRPGINPLASTSETTAAAPKSASAGLYGGGRRLPSSFTGVPPSRRALSAQVPMKEVISLAKYNAPTAGDETEPEEESSFEVSICSPIPAKRHAAQRSISYAQAPFAAAPGRSMLAKLQDALVSGAPDDDNEVPAANGLPGCRDSETDGKILPCFKVKEDGIVRITPQTLENLLRGEYDDHLKAFHIVDCRFDYEFEGGHIEGATNFTAPEDAADYFLNQLPVPPPSSSGEPSPLGELKTVLVFHCEFSAKRGPTFAKHLRAQDRKRCHEAYPRVHYPEVYILQGGYKSFWESHPHRCGGYTEMDDPNHVEARREKIDTMRKWERTRSYTYGERTAAVAALGNNKAAAASAPEALPQRTAGGESASSLSKASGGAPIRRPAMAALSTLVEHHEADTSFGNADSDCSFTGGVGDSPCPANMGAKKNLASAVRPMPSRRAPLGRASTMGPLVFSLKA